MTNLASGALTTISAAELLAVCGGAGDGSEAVEQAAWAAAEQQFAAVKQLAERGFSVLGGKGGPQAG